MIQTPRRDATGRERGSPEPFAYESDFGIRWVAQSQRQGAAELNFDPARGPVQAPLVRWGPYLQAQGPNARQIDGLTRTQSDVRADQLDPSEAGTKRTTALLPAFFKNTSGRAHLVPPSLSA